MRIGVPKEIKPLESRVSLTPDSAQSLTSAGHSVHVETGAGTGSGFADADYVAAGAQIVAAAADVFAQAELIVKVKEPQLKECALLGLVRPLRMKPSPMRRAGCRFCNP
jgi:alanine dehydrogenase